ncbi:hypothetical protein [Caudoviricetes sp.]|nr:hypothetical protein [Caudoviricetes sp.]UOF79677.1 hypothetical protein [Caudoviricetes sp.]UOF79849.1 hypothetical protein [Bacteriophage sp.]UOF81348.1 hypothetical protein [Caudoviricetes sp.]
MSYCRNSSTVFHHETGRAWNSVTSRAIHSNRPAASWACLRIR